MSSKQRKKSFARHTGFLLWHAGNLWQRQIRSALDPVGLTHVQYLLLDTLHVFNEKGSSATQAHIARAAGVDVMMASKVLRHMEKKKLVARKSHRGDARAYSLDLTPEGLRSLTKAHQLVRGSEKEFFACINKPGKFENFLKALTGEKE